MKKRRPSFDDFYVRIAIMNQGEGDNPLFLFFFYLRTEAIYRPGQPLIILRGLAISAKR